MKEFPSDRAVEWVFQWGKYNGITIIVACMLFLAQVIVGNFIRWEVGDVVYASAKEPFLSLSKGWTQDGCFDQAGKKVCAFTKDQ